MTEKPTVFHEANHRFVRALDLNSVEYRLLSDRPLKQALFRSWDRQKQSADQAETMPMDYVGFDGQYHHYLAKVTTANRTTYRRYYIEITDKRTWYLYRHGLDDSIPENGFFEYLGTSKGNFLQVPSWTKNAVFYQIFPERFSNGDSGNDPVDCVSWNEAPTRNNFFGGDLAGIREKIPYLKNLGITAIYLNPIFQAPSNHKYDTTDYFKIDPSFGTMEEFKDLVQELHKQGIRIILDGVFNHSGFTFAPFQDVLQKGQDSVYADWFYVNEFPVDAESVNYECVGYYKWMPKLNYQSKSLREFILSVGIYWIEQAQIDGWRLDVADEIDPAFWQEFREAIKKKNPEAFLLGETWIEGSELLGNHGMDSVMNYLLRDAMIDFFAKRVISAEQFTARLIRMMGNYSSVEQRALYNLFGSHDTERMSEYVQGNTYRTVLAYLIFFKGIPAIYYGDETGLTGKNDPDCRKTFPWNQTDEALIEFTAKLIHLRRRYSEYFQATFQLIHRRGLVGYHYTLGNNELWLIVNPTQTLKHITLPGGHYHSLITDSVWVRKAESEFKVEIQPNYFELILKEEDHV